MVCRLPTTIDRPSRRIRSRRLLSGHGYLLGVLVDFARLPARFAKSASCTCFFEGRVDGVFFFETTFDGRQYWLLASPE